ncbi:helix-turn-helix transcriptional regulator [Rhodovulum sp. MB263]|uniref:helix-turn-helix transcriptional regulator n=1 Tax=Rhodovulum sp. (strain MB263) TaxID=308754 RepID=UPI001E37282B|nr:helix-turn-helix transcriptional regulator [Rhodovulum sp. MB263]
MAIPIMNAHVDTFGLDVQAEGICHAGLLLDDGALRLAAKTGERADMSDMVTIPRDEYERLREAAEDLEDILAYDRAKADMAAGRAELVPAEFVNRIIDGESPVRVYRDLRGLTQAALAEKAGINRVIVAELETGRKQGSAQTLKKIADALGVTVDDLI